MNLILAIIIGIAALWLLAHVITMWVVLSRANSVKLAELRHLQGTHRNVKAGQLANPPKANDFRVIRGLEWRDGKYVPQSRLSVEAIKSAFFAG